jgi:integrase
VGTKSAHGTSFSPSSLHRLAYTAPRLIHLRDGEVVVYRRSQSPVWQCRFKLQDGTWHRQSTKKASIEQAVNVATTLYDQARFRQRLGLAHRTHTFAQIAHATLDELRQQIDAGQGKSVYTTYITCTEKYFLPYFKEQLLEEITHKDILSFEAWRNRQMNRAPKASTLNNFASAWNRILQTAVHNGWVSSQTAIPKLSTRGQKGKARPAFTRREIDYLMVFMEAWAEQGRLAVEREMRPLLRDYVEILLYTGMRHGTEALGLRWCDVSWHEDKGQRYLRLWVDGKTGGRFIIAKHSALSALKRLWARQQEILDISFECIFDCRLKRPVFAFSSGYQPPSLNGTFRRLMRDSGLLKDSDGQARTLYSMRHTYATLELLENGTDIHTVSKQMGNSAAMIERHYSKLTATMAAEKLANLNTRR